jgi:hypothetical protein
MIEIELTRGKVTIIDKEDIDLADFSWYAMSAYNDRFYACRKGKLLHRIIYSRIIKRPLKHNEYVCHINDDPLDNRRSNLRLGTASQAHYSDRRKSDNSSGYIGVTWSNYHKKWEARLKVDKCNKHIGYYDTPLAAAQARDRAAIDLHQEYARLNFPKDKS